MDGVGWGISSRCTALLTVSNPNPSPPPVPRSRKKGPEFLAEFFRVLPRALRHMLSKADDRTRASVNKVVRVWDERKVRLFSC